MAVNYFICLLSKLDDSITELTRMASSSRDVIVNKKGNAMCLVFVHGSAKLSLRYFENLSSSCE